MKLKNIAVVSAVVAGNLFSVTATDAAVVTLYSGTPGTLPYGSQLITEIALLPSGSTVSYSVTAYVIDPDQSSLNPFGASISIRSSANARVGRAGLTFNSDPLNPLTFTGDILTTGDGVRITFDGTGAVATTWNVSNLLVTFLSPSPASSDTIASFSLNTASLRSIFNLQSAKSAQGLSYDCTVFDANNVCVSFAGTRSNGDNGFDATTGALIIAHRPTANIRFGAYVDQNIGTSYSNGLKVKRGSPGYGVFGVWSQRDDGLGTQVRASANSGKVDIETTRLAIDTAEAGFGTSNIKSQGVQLELSQGYALNNQWVARPYLGYRQLTNKRAGYTEAATDTVGFPLSYSSLKQTTESILAGVRFIGKLTPQTSLTLSAGIERDVKSSVDDYKATETDIADMSLSMAENKKKSRPTASFGVIHSIDKTQTIGLSVVHRKEALQSGNTTTGMLQYSVGF